MINIPKLSPFKHFCVHIGNIPTSYEERLSYYEMLEWFCKFLKKEVIPAVNINAEAVTELQNFVKHYFDNLDIQEEINNKLDEMAESGELADIIAEYIKLKGILAYNSVSDMKLAENLVNGSFAETYGFYSNGDGGSAKYKIREIINTDVIDEVTLIALHDPSLVAELIINNNMDVKQFGATGNGISDDTQYIQIALNKMRYKKLTLSNGTYLVDSLVTNSIYIVGNDATIKAKSDNNLPLLTINEYCEIDNIIFNGNNIINNLIHNNVFKIKLTNCYFKNSLLNAIENTPIINNDTAYFENIIFDNCVGGIKYLGYDESNDYKGRIEFINCKSFNNTGSSDDNRIYMFQKLNYVYIEGGEFTGDAEHGATNIYQVNHAEVIGGYYHDILRGVTLGQITKNCIVCDTINENITESGGLHIDLVTNDRIYPLGHSIISNNIVKNAYRGIYVQGKNIILNNNYIYCGDNTTSTGGVIRFNNEDDNVSNSNIFCDNLFVYNLGNNNNVINTGTAIVTFGKNIILEGDNILYGSIASSNTTIFKNKIEASSNIYLNPTNEIIMLDASNGSFNVFLPKTGDANICGKKYTLIRTDSTANNISLRCRSDGGNINGTPSGVGNHPILTGITEVIQISAGTYYSKH